MNQPVTVTRDAATAAGECATGTGRVPSPSPSPASCRSHSPSLWLAWAVTIAEGILWGALAWVFADYWLMLPVRYRWWGIVILGSLAAVGGLRLAHFYRRLRRATRAGSQSRDGHRSTS